MVNLMTYYICDGVTLQRHTESLAAFEMSKRPYDRKTYKADLYRLAAQIHSRILVGADEALDIPDGDMVE